MCVCVCACVCTCECARSLTSSRKGAKMAKTPIFASGSSKIFVGSPVFSASDSHASLGSSSRRRPLRFCVGGVGWGGVGWGGGTHTRARAGAHTHKRIHRERERERAMHAGTTPWRQRSSRDPVGARA